MPTYRRPNTSALRSKLNAARSQVRRSTTARTQVRAQVRVTSRSTPIVFRGAGMPLATGDTYNNVNNGVIVNGTVTDSQIVGTGTIAAAPVAGDLAAHLAALREAVAGLGGLTEDDRAAAMDVLDHAERTLALPAVSETAVHPLLQSVATLIEPVCGALGRTPTDLFEFAQQLLELMSAVS